SAASFQPMNRTRRCSLMSLGLTNRPPACGLRLRIGPNSGDTPETSTASLFADRLDVVLVETDLPPLAEALERHGRQPRPGDADRVPDAGAVEDHLRLQALAEGEEQGHGDRPPHDAEDRQERAELLAPHVAPHLAQGISQGKHGYARLSVGLRPTASNVVGAGLAPARGRPERTAARWK